MMEKKSKYDTNPLDPDFARRTEEVRGSTDGVGTHGAGPEQSRRGESGGVDAEAPTRYYPQPQPQFDDRAPTSYPSVFVPPTYQPPVPRPPAQPFIQARTQGQQRNVPGIWIPERVATILPYLPFPLVGVVPGLVELLLVPRTELRTRYHAAQGLALHLVVLVISTLLSTSHSIVSRLVGGPPSVLLAIASTLFPIAAFVFFIISMIRVWKGETHHIAPLTEATRWLNEGLEPRK